VIVHLPVPRSSVSDSVLIRWMIWKARRERGMMRRSIHEQWVNHIDRQTHVLVLVHCLRTTVSHFSPWVVTDCMFCDSSRSPRVSFTQLRLPTHPTHQSPSMTSAPRQSRDRKKRTFWHRVHVCTNNTGHRRNGAPRCHYLQSGGRIADRLIDWRNWCCCYVKLFAAAHC